jgi:hypothetical protein
MGNSIPLIVNVILIGVVIILAITIGVLTFLVIQLQKKLRIFMNGKDAANLETTLFDLTEKSKTIEQTLQSHKEGLEYIDARVKRSIRGYSLVRYDAYDNAGGEQSFASGLLDEYGDGYVLSVITNRNHVGVYAKKIVAGKAETSLTPEEEQALNTAKQPLEL